MADKCPICGGILYEPDDEPGKMKCVHCGRYFKEGKGMDTNEQAEKRLTLETRKTIKFCANPDCGKEFIRKCNHQSFCEECAADREGNKKKKFIPEKRRSSLPQKIKATGADGQELVFIGTQALLNPAKEIRVELVYTLTEAKIVKEG